MDQTLGVTALQNAVDHVVVRKDVKLSGIFATIFGVLAVLAGAAPPFEPLLFVVGAMLSAAGLWNLTNPHPRGIAFMGVCLIAVGAYNIASLFLEAAAGGKPFVGWGVLGFWQIVWGVQSFPRYRRFAHAFEHAPTSVERERAQQVIRDLQRAKVKESPDVVEFVATGLTPQACRARLAADHVLCLIGAGEDARVCPRGQFDVEVTGHARFGKNSKVVVHANGRALQGEMKDEHLDRFRAWKTGAAPPLHAAA
jgi:hypothetical protein